MNKLVAYLAFLLIGIGIGYLIWGQDAQMSNTDPQVHRLWAEIGWRQKREDKIKDSLKLERQEKHILAKENIELRTIANKAIDRYKEVRKAIPLTHNDTIVFLMRDTIACDSALLRSKELVNGLTIEIMTDNAIIKGQGELIDSLQADKKDLIKIDSLNQIDKKSLRKANRKKFFKGLGIGGVLGVILALLL